jgi:UDP-glucose 6-dehydrogenase
MIEFGKLDASSWNVMSALLHDTVNFNSPAYLMPGSGNGGPCHPRDGVVLSYLTDKFGMRSQLLKAVTQARQDQAAALAEHLISYGLPIVILGESFKPGVDLTVGSYSVLVGNICKQLGGTVLYDQAINDDAVVMLAHRNVDLIRQYAPTANSVIVDLWNLGIQGHTVKIWGNRLP